jgi:hypothetical protein
MTLDICEDLFREDEKEFIRINLREKALKPCLTYIRHVRSGSGHANNIYIVLLHGYTISSLVLGETANINYILDSYNYAAGFFNTDSYGESVGYWDYSSRMLCTIYEELLRYDATLASDLKTPYVYALPWVCASLLGRKKLAGWNDKPYTRFLNMGDSPASYRISGCLALHIANRMKISHPREAGLARWLFEYCYKDAETTDNRFSPYGFMQNFNLFTLLHYPEAAPALSPAQANLPLAAAFEVGHVIVRDQWEDPQTIWSLAGGYEPLQVASHRHHDQNSLTITHLGERILVDGGHCCYRLQSQKFSKSSQNHSTWRFITADGKLIDQKDVVTGKPLNRRLLFQHDGVFAATASDAADVYGYPIRKAERMVLSIGKHVLFLIDTIEAEEPVTVEERFVLNNEDGLLKQHIVSPSRMVFRRAGAGLKLILASANVQPDLGFSWGYVHQGYHPRPNQPSQGKEGSAIIITQKNRVFEKKHQLVYAIVLSDEKDVGHWHVYVPQTGVYEIESPKGKSQYRVYIRINSSGISVLDGSSGKEWSVPVGGKQQ